MMYEYRLYTVTEVFKRYINQRVVGPRAQRPEG